MKGDVSLQLYMALVVMVGLILIAAVYMRLSPLDSPRGRTMELAMVVSMHIDALSTVSEGGLKIDTGKNKYDVEIQRWSGFWRGVGSAITPYIPLVPDVDPNGNYVVVTPYDDKGVRLDKQSSTFFLNSYDTEKDYGTPKIEKTSLVCLTKASKEEGKDNIARLVKCE